MKYLSIKETALRWGISGSVKDWTLSTAVNMVKGIEGRGCLILGIVLQNAHHIIC